MKLLKRWIVWIAVGWSNVVVASENAELVQQALDYADPVDPYHKIVMSEAISKANFARANKVFDDFKEAFLFYKKNSLEARNKNFLELFLREKINIEQLLGLYEVLKSFRNVAGDSFNRKDLNIGLTEYNYKFLKSVFGS